MAKLNNTTKALLIVIAFTLVGSIIFGIENLLEEDESQDLSQAVAQTLEAQGPRIGFTPETCIEDQRFYRVVEVEPNGVRSFFHCPKVQEIFYGEVLVSGNHLQDVMLICGTETESILDSRFKKDGESSTDTTGDVSSQESFELGSDCIVEFVIRNDNGRFMSLQVLSFKMANDEGKEVADECQSITRFPANSSGKSLIVINQGELVFLNAQVFDDIDSGVFVTILGPYEKEHLISDGELCGGIPINANYQELIDRRRDMQEARTHEMLCMPNECSTYEVPSEPSVDN